MKVVVALTLIILAGVVVGCAGSPGRQAATLGVCPSAEDLPISWDHPFLGQGRQNVDPGDLTANPASYGVPLRPVTPQFTSGTLRWVDLTAGAGGTVAYMFDFSGNPAFTTDARAQVEESWTDFSQDEAMTIGSPSAHGNVTDVGPIKVLVLPARCATAAYFVYGSTMFEVLGPALRPAAALDLATQLALQLEAPTH